MRKYFITSIFLLLVNSLSARQYSLFECWELALRHYPLIKGKELLAQTTDLNIQNIEKEWFPQMELSGQASWQSDVPHVDMETSVSGFNIPLAPKDQYKFAIDVNQTIYAGGRIKARKEMEGTTGAVEKQNIEVQLYDVKKRVTELYFSVLMLDEQKQQIEQKMQTLSARIDELKTAFENGMISMTELKTLEAEYLLARQQKVSVQHTLSVVLDNLSSYIGEDISSASQITKPDVAGFLEPVIRPEYRLFKLEQEQTEAASFAQRRERWPVIAAFAQAGYGNPGYNMLKDEFDTFMMVGIRIKWTPWDWKTSKRKQLALQYRSDLIGLREDAFDENLQRLVQQITGEIHQYMDMMEMDDKIVELRRDIVHQSRNRLKNGTITSADYIADLNAEIDARINREIHQLQYLKRLAEKYLTGRDE
jgi:outer membrane protein TolC